MSLHRISPQDGQIMFGHVNSFFDEFYYLGACSQFPLALWETFHLKIVRFYCNRFLRNIDPGIVVEH